MGHCDENLDATQMDMKNSLNEKLEEKYGYTRVVLGWQVLRDIFWNDENTLRVKDIENMKEDFPEYFSDEYVLK